MFCGIGAKKAAFIMSQAFNFTGFMRTQLAVMFSPRLVLGLMLILLSFSGQGQTLGQALNAPGLTWTMSGTGGGMGWFVENTAFFTHDGVSAVRSSAGAFQSFTLQTTVTGPGKITFWWNDNFSSSTLAFTVSGILVTNTYQWGFWRKETIFLGAGSQTLRWINSGTNVGGVNQTVYLDEVNYEPGTFAPEIVVQPLAQSQVVGLDAMFNVVAQGTAPLSYQWQFNGSDVGGATNRTLVISNVQSSVLGGYRVIVTNASGAVTSVVASIELGQVAAWGRVDDNGWATATNGLTNIIGIAAGAVHDLALRNDGHVYGWNYNPDGQISISQNLTNGVSLVAGLNSSALLLEDGTMTVWGAPYGTTSVTNIPSGLSNLVQIVLGASHALALNADGNVVAWGGGNFGGQTNVPVGMANVVAVAVGGSHSLVLKVDGNVKAWGYNFNGQTNVPVSVTNAVAICSGVTHCLALNADGTVVAWGDNSSGATNVPSGLTNIVAIQAGLRFSVALKADGTVVAWGNNSLGQTNVPRNLTNVVAISAGRNHALALVGDGPPVTSAAMRNPEYTVTGFKVIVSSQSGRVYRLEYKNSPADAEWTPLPLVAGNGKDLVLTDATALDAGRFYRVRRW